MYLDYSEPGELKLSMIKYLQKVIGKLPEELRVISATPAANHMFQMIGEEEAYFSEEDWSEIFHHLVSLLLFISSRSRRDIQTAVSFLTTRVKQPYEDDWWKLK